MFMFTILLCIINKDVFMWEAPFSCLKTCYQAEYLYISQVKMLLLTRPMKIPVLVI